MSVISQVLHNNIVLIIEPVENVQTASIGFWFSIGSRNETCNVRGASHFVEHMLFKNTSSMSARQIAAAFDIIGGYVNAYTEREDVCVHCVVPALHIEKAISVLCDMSQNALLREEDIEKERDVIESEIISSLDDPEEAALDAVIESIWPENSISQTIAGSVEQIKQLDYKKLFSWYKENFANGELTVCVAGNVEIQPIITILEKCTNHKKQNSNYSYMDFLKNNNTVEKQPLLKKIDIEKIDIVPNIMPIWKTGVSFVKADFQQEQFFVLFPVKYPITERGYYIHSLINALAGDTMSSRLFQRLRENGGYCYNVYSFFSFYTDTALWCAYGSSAKSSSVLIVSELLDELSKLVTEEFTTEEIESAKEHLCGEEIISSEDIEYRMKKLSRNYVFNFPNRTTKEIIELIRSIELKEIYLYIKELVDFNKSAVIVYGQTLSKKIRDSIKRLYNEKQS